MIEPSTFTAGTGESVFVMLENPVTETLGSFSIVKGVSGDGSGLIEDGAVFQVTYSYPEGDGFAAGGGTVDVVLGGEPTVVEGIPAGAVVTLEESDPAAVDGVTCLDPVFSENGFTVVAGQLIEIDLDNPTTLNQGQFSIVKIVDGSGAELVAPETEFTVNYSYPAGTGFEAGEGSLTVRADGVVVTSEPLPFGAVVTLEEAAPADLEGITWIDAELSQIEVTIGDGTVSK